MRHIALTGLFVALGLVLPMAFHAVGFGGPVFLPMHIPVLLAGLLLGPVSGLAVGLLAPTVSHLLTGMPPLSPPVLPLMIVELAAYGSVSGGLARRFQGRVLLPLAGALVAGRIALGLTAAVGYGFFGLEAPPLTYVAGAVITGLPGLALQVVLVPLLVRALARLQGRYLLQEEGSRHA